MTASRCRAAGTNAILRRWQSTGANGSRNGKGGEENSALRAAQAMSFAPLGVLGATLVGTYVSDDFRAALDKRFPRIMSSLRSVLPGLPPHPSSILKPEPESEPESEPEGNGGGA